MAWGYEPNDPFDLNDVVLFCMTDKALQLGREGCLEEERFWIPTSQILYTDFDYLEDEDCLYTKGTVHIPTWLAEKKGLL